MRLSVFLQTGPSPYVIVRNRQLPLPDIPFDIPCALCLAVTLTLSYCSGSGVCERETLKYSPKVGHVQWDVSPPAYMVP